MEQFSQEKSSWYVVYTKPNKEFQALKELQNQNYVCFLPTFIKQKIRGKKIEDLAEPLFSRYLFIRFDIRKSNWTPVNSTRGVCRIVSLGGQFATVPDVIVDALRNSSQMKRQSMFANGDRVVITSGPFAGLEGIFQSSNGEARAVVLMELLSSPQKLMFAIETLRKAA